MSYTIIHPPIPIISDNFRDLPKKVLREYFQWFLDVIPQRVAMLAETVRETPGFENWQTNFTPDSLNTLGEWLSKNAELRKLTPEERQAILDRPKFNIVVTDDIITIHTVSLAIDVGMYLSQVMLKNHRSLKWVQPLAGSKRAITYGRPCLGGSGELLIDPVHFVHVVANNMARKHDNGSALYNIYKSKIKALAV